MPTWQFGGLAPVFNGPDISPLSVLATASGTIQIGTRFTLDQSAGTMTFSNVGDAPANLTFHAASGSYTYVGTLVAGSYTMMTRAIGSESSYTDYTWVLTVNAVLTKPVFSGPIDDQVATGTHTFDASTYATGQTSYAMTPATVGVSFNTTTGVFTFDSTKVTGVSGPYTVQYINSTGTTLSNPFYDTVQVAVVVPVFTGTIPNQSATGTHGLDVSTYATGQTSYSYSPITAGVSFNTSTGFFTFDSAVLSGTTGPYTVQYINSAGSTSSNSFTDTMQVPVPVLVGTIPNQVGAGTHSFDSSTYATGETSYSYSPIRAGVTINASTGVLTFNSAQLSGTTGPYTVTFTNAGGSVTSNTFTDTMQVLVVRPSLVGTIPDRVATGTHTFNVSTYATGQTSYSYTPLTTGVSFNTATGVFTFDSSVLSGTTGPYRVTFTNSAGSTQSNTFTDTVAVAAPVFAGPIPNQSGTGTHSVNVSGYASGQTSYSYSPTTAGVSFDTSTGVFTFDAAVLSGITGPYTVTFTNSGGSTDSNTFYDTVNAVVIPVPVLVGTIPNQVGAGNHSFDASVYATGETSYSYSPVTAGVSINASTGVMSFDSAVLSGVTGPYTVIYTNSGGDTSSNTFTDNLQAVAVAPVFSGPIPDQVGTGTHTLNASSYATGQTSYSYLPATSGVSINSATGILTFDGNVITGLTGPYTVIYTNSTGSTSSNIFTDNLQPVVSSSNLWTAGSLTITADTDAATADGWFAQVAVDTNDYSDETLQLLLDPGGNYTGIRIIRKAYTGTTVLNYYVHSALIGASRPMWTDVLSTDPASARAAKIRVQLAIPAQPVWPLPT